MMQFPARHLRERNQRLFDPEQPVLQHNWDGIHTNVLDAEIRSTQRCDFRERRL